ncbi:Polysaccharide biosynthesis protein [uncultured archaeon]|nr:Polysaccharide biosynthesis protein [uncultured archaeon]
MKKRIQNLYIKHKETIHNFIWRSLQIFGKQGVTFLIFIIAAKLLTPFEFGIYNYVLAVVFFLIIFGDFGISIAASNYVAEYNAIDEKKVRCVLFNSGIVILGLSSIVTLITIVFGKYFLSEKFVYVLWTLPMFFFALMTSLYDGIYRGLKRFERLSIISLITGFLSLGYVYYLIKNFGLLGALISQNIFYLLLFLVLALDYKDYDFIFNKEILKKITSYSLWIGLSNIGLFLYTRVDIIILGQFGFIEEIGYYEIINKIFIMILMPVTLLATVVAPNTAKNFALGRFDYIKDKIIKESLLLLLIGLLVSGLSFWIIPLIFKNFLEEYNLGLLILMLNLIIILVPFKFFSSYISIGYITPSGNVKILTNTLLIYGLLNITLDFILIHSFGFIGVIYATLISQFLFIITTDVYFYKKILTR